MARAMGRSVETERWAAAKRAGAVALSRNGELPEAPARRWGRSSIWLEVLLMLALGFGVASSARHVAGVGASAGCGACVVGVR